MAQASQALVYAMLVEAHQDRQERSFPHNRRTKRMRILPDFLG
ncbi:MAG TPA: hypothetical protein VFX15_11465 [Actinomycetes bacterium]|nr:hypothetical protein [Actinomycetes bacterium]